MTSLFMNNLHIGIIDVYLVTTGISENNKRMLVDTAKKFGRDLHIIDAPLINIPETLITERWPYSAFVRLFLSEILPKGLSRVIYLDCDTIIDGDVSYLDTFEMGDRAIWGVKDCVGKEYKKNIGLSYDAIYINAGVLVIDLKKLKEIDIIDRVWSFLKKYKRLINYADQDLLNGCLNDNIGFISPQYNLMTIVAKYNYYDIERLRHPTNYYSFEEIDKACFQPIIIHYTSNMRVIRPWYNNSDHPFGEVFDDYLSHTPWRERKMDKENSMTKEEIMISFVNLLPDRLSKYILGWAHSKLKPVLIRVRSIYGSFFDTFMNRI